MTSKIICTSLFALLFSFSYAQFDIPPGGIPGFPPDNSNCPPGVWCHPDGVGLSITNDDIDAINDALENPKGCVGSCALGKLFIDLLKDLYPDCYPNCNLETKSSSRRANPEEHINQAKPVALKGEISRKTYKYFTQTLPKRFKKSGGEPIALEFQKDGKFKLGGMWVYNEKERNEFRVMSLEPLDTKSGVAYDRIYLTYTEKNLVVLNQAWIDKNAKKGKTKNAYRNKNVKAKKAQRRTNKRR